MPQPVPTTCAEELTGALITIARLVLTLHSSSHSSCAYRTFASVRGSTRSEMLITVNLKSRIRPSGSYFSESWKNGFPLRYSAPRNCHSVVEASSQRRNINGRLGQVGTRDYWLK